MTSLEFWEFVEYATVLVVILGIVGEYVADFTKVSKCEHAKEKLGKRSTLILIAGIAAELVALVMVSHLSGKQIAVLEGANLVLRSNVVALELRLDPNRPVTEVSAWVRLFVNNPVENIKADGPYATMWLRPEGTGPTRTSAVLKLNAIKLRKGSENGLSPNQYELDFSAAPDISESLVSHFPDSPARDLTNILNCVNLEIWLLRPDIEVLRGSIDLLLNGSVRLHFDIPKQRGSVVYVWRRGDRFLPSSSFDMTPERLHALTNAPDAK